MVYRLTVIFGVLTYFIMLSTHSQASDTSTTVATINIKDYEECLVFDGIDLSTDELTHYLSCGGLNINDTTQVLFIFNDYGERMVLDKGEQFISGNQMDVTIQVDQGKVRKRTWIHYNGLPYSYDKTLISTLLNEIAKGKHMMIKVGKKTGNIPLDGSADAVDDYKARVALRK